MVLKGLNFTIKFSCYDQFESFYCFGIYFSSIKIQQVSRFEEFNVNIFSKTFSFQIPFSSLESRIKQLDSIQRKLQTFVDYSKEIEIVFYLFWSSLRSWHFIWFFWFEDPDYKKSPQIARQEQFLKKKYKLVPLDTCLYAGNEKGEYVKYKSQKKNLTDYELNCTSAIDSMNIYLSSIYSIRRLQCPSCEKSNFLNSVGFMNHCRTLHKVKFSTFAEACHFCGVQVVRSKKWSTEKLISQFVTKQIAAAAAIQEEREIPASDPCRMQKIKFTIKSKKRRREGEVINEKETFPAHLQVTDVSNLSRFYAKQRIVVGNTSKLIPLEKMKEGQPPYKWMVFVIGMEGVTPLKKYPILLPFWPPKNQSPRNKKDLDIQHYVQKVKFFLDPSFAPNDVVEVTSPPFKLSRLGWGEFPIRIQIFFKDPRTKPVNVIHQIKVNYFFFNLQHLTGQKKIFLIQVGSKSNWNSITCKWNCNWNWAR